MSRGLHFVTHVAVTHVAIFMATCMFSLGALGAWQPKTKKDLVDAIGGSGCPTSRIVGPADEPISEWDVSRVTDMSYLFKDCKNFNEDISDWETSRVTTFKRMFEDAAKFNVDISSWKTKRAQTFEHMFEDAAIFNADISSWNTASSQTFYYMFGGATTFNQPLGSWNTGTATNFFAMFYGATAFNQPLGSWNTAKAWTFQNMFHQATAFNQPLDSWNTAKATYFRYMFEGATAFNQPLGSWNTGKVTDFHDIFSGTSVDIDTTAYWDTTNTGSELFKLLSPQQPCPAGYNASQTYPIGTGAQYGTLARRCPDGCNLAGYYEQPNGVCSECAVAHCNVCTSNPTTECDTCATGYNVNSNHTACECVFGTEPTVDGLLCTDCTTKLHADRYYVTQANCTTVLCTTRAATEYFNKSAVYTADTCSVATCAFGEEPAGDGLSCTDCPTKLHPDQYYNTQGSCTSERKRTSESDLALPLGLGLGMGALVVIMGAVIVVLVVKKKRGKPMFTRLGDDPDK